MKIQSMFLLVNLVVINNLVWLLATQSFSKGYTQMFLVVTIVLSVLEAAIVTDLILSHWPDEVTLK